MRLVCRICLRVLILGLALAPARAQDSGAPLGICAKSSASCRELAVEVARLDYQDYVQEELDSHRGAGFLCPEDNPDCCPEEEMPICSQINNDVVRAARDGLHTAMAGTYDDCPWSKSICDSLGSFYCGPDGGWTPWGGCSEGVVIDVPDPFPPPVICKCNERPNSKGICIPKVCTYRGFRVPCRPCGDQVVVATHAERTPTSNLERQLQDPQVQLEAAKRVHADLTAALAMIEKEIQELEE